MFRQSGRGFNEIALKSLLLGRYGVIPCSAEVEKIGGQSISRHRHAKLNDFALSQGLRQLGMLRSRRPNGAPLFG